MENKIAMPFHTYIQHKSLDNVLPTFGMLDIV